MREHISTKFQETQILYGDRLVVMGAQTAGGLRGGAGVGETTGGGRSVHYPDCQDGLMSAPRSLHRHLVPFIVRQSHLTKAVKKKP